MLGSIFDEAIRLALHRGESQAAISRMLGVDPEFVSRRMLRNGWRERGKPRRTTPLPVKEPRIRVGPSYGLTPAQRDIYDLYRRKRFTALEARALALETASGVVI